MSAAPRAVLIDLDGTLMDTAPDLAEAANRMRGDFGLAPLPVERIAAFVGKGAEVLVHRALTDDAEGRAPDAEFARGRSAFYRHYHAVNGAAALLFPDALDALAMLRALGLRLACVTNKPREFTVPLLAGRALDRAFDAVVAGDDVPHKKPHPALLLEGCARLAVAPAEAIMVGDSINDAQAARRAGMRVVLVETGYNEGESVRTLSPEAASRRDDGLSADAIVPRLLDAARWIAAGLGGERGRA